jgi:bifunctional non-homologous end joining protein LigD
MKSKKKHMIDLLKSLAKEDQDKIKKKSEPDWVDPMLATLTKERFSDPEWIFERKLDGERCLTYRGGGQVRMMSRNKKELNIHYPDLEIALAGLDVEQYIVDGEIVAFEGDITSFSRLQQRMHIQDSEQAKRSDVAVFYYIFDLLYVNGFDVSQLPQRQRKSLLKRAFDYKDPLRYMIHRTETGERYFDEACQRGWEGIIAKDGKKPYVNGRSRAWLKFKCVSQQEFVIGGYTDPHGERIGFGALLLGYYDNDKLRYAGKVGTGFDNKTLNRLHTKLKKLNREKPPFYGQDLPSSEVHWVNPQLVAEVGFEEWTAENKLRQPRYLGLRTDKDPHDVIKEEPVT